MLTNWKRAFMSSRILYGMQVAALLATVFTLSACDAMVNRSKASASITQRALNDATGVWTDVFTYHAPEEPPQPQTRYCYKMSSDIVCYDSVQPSLSAKLIGYQDGESRSWIQPGGGSLGASGGNPVALRPQKRGKIQQADVIQTRTAIEDRAVEQVSQGGEISVTPLPPK